MSHTGCTAFALLFSDFDHCSLLIVLFFSAVGMFTVSSFLSTFRQYKRKPGEASLMCRLDPLERQNLLIEAGNMENQR